MDIKFSNSFCINWLRQTSNNDTKYNGNWAIAFNQVYGYGIGLSGGCSFWWCTTSKSGFSYRFTLKADSSATFGIIAVGKAN